MPQPASKYCVLGIGGGGGYSCPKLPNPLICFQTWTRLILHGICNFLLKLLMIWSLMVYILLSYIFMHTWLPDYHLCSRIILTNQSNISARLISLWCSCIYVHTVFIGTWSLLPFYVPQNYVSALNWIPKVNLLQVSKSVQL